MSYKTTVGEMDKAVEEEAAGRHRQEGLQSEESAELFIFIIKHNFTALC